MVAEKPIDRYERKPRKEITIMVQLLHYSDGPMTDQEIIQKVKDMIIVEGKSVQETGQLGERTHIRIRGEDEKGLIYERSVSDKASFWDGVDKDAFKIKR